MLVFAGVLLLIGACCVLFVKEGTADRGKEVVDVPDSEAL